ncbi:YcxB family protein [Fusobacterium sp. PH5-44]|uniref:YcxB family protein n=1 Tax=unclassified Fusobacterium TaxID=2648384 RepID=UPI003D1C9B4F
MKYEYTYKNTASELWQLSMYQIYGSIVGMCNIVFTFGMGALLVSRRNYVNNIFTIILILLVCWFPIIQPFLIYKKCQKQENNITDNTNIIFDNVGIQAKFGKQRSNIPWSKIRKISKKPTMLIVFTDGKHGYVLSNNVLRSDKEQLYDFILSKINNK